LTNLRFFSTSQELQDFLLRESGGALVVVPHRRLAHQVWHRQRTREMEQGRAAWEPLPLVTLQGWFTDLFRSLWPKEALASTLTRLARWRLALKEVPPPAGPTPELEWAQALDAAHNLLCRHQLPVLEPAAADSPLVAWRRQVTRTYVGLLREEGWLSPGELPAYLRSAWQAGKVKLPGKVLLVGLETPAPAETAWLQILEAGTEVQHLQVRGDLQAVAQAAVLPDRGQETEWVAASLLESARQDGIPLHRLAVTSPDLDSYTPHLRQVLEELLGPAQDPGGWAYNFSQGPCLADTPLFQAALLPLRFAAGERREELVSLLLSPYGGALQKERATLACWDRIFRQERADQGWDRLRGAAARNLESPGTAETLARLDRVRDTLQVPAAGGREWAAHLQAAWAVLGFPGGLEAGEPGQWSQLTALLAELGQALGTESLAAGEFGDWLTQGARQLLLPGPGVQEAGIQVLGLLEMRGLAFARVFCLGLNSGVFPPPPRPLPLLNAAEKQAVLGGTYQSQHHFARELFSTFLGAAPEIILTRPRLTEDEERVGSPLYPGRWEPQEAAVLSVPRAAWLRSLAVKAAFRSRSLPPFAGYGDGLFSLPLPSQLTLSQVAAALRCPCRFLLEVLLAVTELPEMEAGLDPRERGELLHQVLARFAADYQAHLDQGHSWDGPQARERLEDAVHQLLAHLRSDLHWQAEWDRWLGEGGLLWEWLWQEEERFHQGWRWHGFEVRFQDLKGSGWQFAVRGRIDRLDHHPEQGRLMVWDYKSGEVPSAKKVFVEADEHQLPCYLLAVRRGRVDAPAGTAELGAGFIGLKSSREKHLRYEDFEKQGERWAELLKEWEERVQALSRRLAAGDFGPQPTPAPAGRQQGACSYCSLSLICGFTPEPAPEEGEEEGE
jgi:RecB family exonuclease